jgi:hypothetical protein
MKGQGFWKDCDAIPFEYAVHLAQHNERTLSRLFRVHKDQRKELRYHQRWRRFAGAVNLDKPESWLWACSAGAAKYTDEQRGNPAAGWCGAMNLLNGKDTALVYDDEENIITTRKVA